MSPGDVSPIKPVTRRVEREEESPTRPVAPPKSDKDFKKIASRRERPADTDGPSEEGEEVAGVDEESSPTSTDGPSEEGEEVAGVDEESSPTSIFALAAASGVKKAKPDRSSLSPEEGMDVENLPKEPKPILKKGNRDEEDGWGGEIEKPAEQKKSAEPSVRSQFGENRPDLAGFPPIVRAGEVEQPLSVKVPVDPKPVLRDLAAELIKEIQTLRTGDKTDTIVTLRFPPLFEGATVTLTTMDSAKRQFDILFANLSDQAKLLLDNKLANDSLMLALERKGFQVHTISTTTQDAAPIQVESDQATKRQPGEEKGGEEGRGGNSQYYRER